MDTMQKTKFPFVLSAAKIAFTSAFAHLGQLYLFLYLGQLTDKGTVKRLGPPVYSCASVRE